jgi:hypothetical protein
MARITAMSSAPGGGSLARARSLHFSMNARDEYTLALVSLDIDGTASLSAWVSSNVVAYTHALSHSMCFAVLGTRSCMSALPGSASMRHKRPARRTEFVMWGPKLLTKRNCKTVHVCVRFRERAPPPEPRRIESVVCRWNRLPMYRSGTLVSDPRGNIGVVVGTGVAKRARPLAWCTDLDVTRMCEYVVRTEQQHFAASFVAQCTPEPLRPTLPRWTYECKRYERVLEALRVYHATSGRAMRFRISPTESMPVFHYLHPDKVVGVMGATFGPLACAWAERLADRLFHETRSLYKE